MQTQQPTKPPATDTSANRGWLAAAAAFVVILAIGAVVLLATGTESQDPTTPEPNPTTTTVATQDDAAPATSTTVTTTTIATVAQEPTAEDLAFAEALAAAYNAEDIDAYIALLPPEVAFTDPNPDSNGQFTVTELQIRRDNQLWWELDQRLTLEGCRLLSDTGRISCRYAATDIFSDAVGFPAPVATLIFQQEDGRATEYSEAWQLSAHVDYTRQLRGWFDENKPDEPRPFERGFNDYGRWAHMDPEDPALILLHLDEFVASLSN